MITDLILSGLESNPGLVFERNTDNNIECGAWVYKLSEGDKVLLYTMDDDITPLERLFLQIPLWEIRRDQGLEYPDTIPRPKITCIPPIPLQPE